MQTSALRLAAASSGRCFVWPRLCLAAPLSGRAFVCPRLCLSAPLSVRAFVAAVSLMTGLLLSPLAARAGSYAAPTFTGTTGTVTYDSGGTPGNYQTSATGFNLPGFPMYSTNAAGTVTVSYVWQSTSPGDAPTSVIVKETRDASWFAYYTVDPIGSCSDGWASDPEVDTVFAMSPPDSNYFGDSSGTHYSVLTPDANGNVTVTVSGLGASLAPALDDFSPFWVSVSDTLTVTPVTINLTGTTLVNGQQEALTGQRITATLNAPFPVVPTSYAWNASGGMFKNYDWTLASNQKTELDDADYFQSSFTFYDATAETVTPTCSARVICPDGTQLDVSAKQPIPILKPMETAWTIGSTQNGDGPFTSEYLNNGAFDPLYGVQVTWNPITITVPLPFTGGQACLVQIANLNRVATRVALNGASNTYVVIPAAEGLDTGFPYKIAYQLDAQGNIVSGNDGMYNVLSPPQWNVPGTGAGGDRPYTVCEPPLVNGDTGGEDWRSSSDTDQFQTWTMYQPPPVSGQPTVWVPLQMINWGWSGSASVHTDAAGKVIVDANGNAIWYFTVPEINPVGNPANTVMFPIWTTILPYGLTVGPPAH